MRWPTEVHLTMPRVSYWLNECHVISHPSTATLHVLLHRNLLGLTTSPEDNPRRQIPQGKRRWLVRWRDGSLFWWDRGWSSVCTFFTVYSQPYPLLYLISSTHLRNMHPRIRIEGTYNPCFHDQFIQTHLNILVFSILSKKFLPFELIFIEYEYINYSRSISCLCMERL